MWLAMCVRVLAFSVPVTLAVGLTALTHWLVPAPAPGPQRAAWWVTLLLVVTGALFIGDRLARRLLPLAAFLELSLAFPDRAPSRFRLALRSSTRGQLRLRVEQLQRNPLEGDASEAAGRVLELVAMLTDHDRITRGHSERVRAYADLLADEFGLAPAARDRLRWAALLHDVGKVIVPAEVLNKPGPLDPSERAEVQAHPLKGEELTRSLQPWLGEWALAVGQHHEWWDGSGYPRGLRGGEISLAARIVAVADAFEVMTAPRPYKQPMSANAARRELVRAAGVQFDPTVVRAFLSISLGSLHSAMGLAAWLGQIPFLERVAFRSVVRGTATVVATGAALIAGGVVDVKAPPPGGVKVLGAVERPFAAGPGTPIVAAPAVVESPSPAAAPRPVPSSLAAPVPRPPGSPPPPVGSLPAPPGPLPTTRPAPAEAAPSTQTIPAQPDPAEPAPARGRCTAFFNGSGNGRTHKDQAPPADALVTGAVVVGQTIEQYCSVVRAATGDVVDFGLVAGSPDFDDPGGPEPRR